MAASDFWSNRERAQRDVEEVSRLRSLISPFQELERQIEDFSALQQLAAEESDPTGRAHAEKEVAAEHAFLIRKLDEFELRQFLSGENDRANAFLTIHSGAGGTESCDWADMLLRMYQRWIERSGFKSQTVDIQQGEEVGIKLGPCSTKEPGSDNRGIDLGHRRRSNLSFRRQARLGRGRPSGH